MEKHKLYDKLISSENIYKAIYSLHSYIQEPDLLDTSRESTYFNDLGYSDKALYDIVAKMHPKRKRENCTVPLSAHGWSRSMAGCSGNSSICKNI